MSADYYSIDPMKETEQTLLDQIKDQVAKDHGMDTCAFALNVYAKSDARRIDLMIDEIAERYAEAKAKASCEATLIKASENAKLIEFSPCTNFVCMKAIECDHPCEESEMKIDKSSITDPNNITIV